MVAKQNQPKPEEINGNHLNGMKEICVFLARAESTVLAWKRRYSTMPIAKIGGIWVGDRRDLDKWRRLHAKGQAHQWEREGGKKPVKEKSTSKTSEKQ